LRQRNVKIVKLRQKSENIKYVKSGKISECPEFLTSI